MNGNKDEQAPELHNSEQDDDDAQAQGVASDAMALGSAADKAEQSVRGGSSGLDLDGPEDEPDLVDKMEQMVASGIIDDGAFAGEPEHDDELDTHGNRDDEDEDETDEL